MANTGRTKYKNDWQRDHADRIGLNVPKGQRAVIRNHAQAHDESVNAFINRAISEAIERDQEKDKRKQEVARITDESGRSPGEVEHDMEIEEALAILAQEIPDIRHFYSEQKRRQQLRLGKLHPQITILDADRHK